MANNTTTLYSFTTTPTVASKNYTTLYSGETPVLPVVPYGNANVEAFLNVGTDGGNTVENILANGSITANGSVNVGANLSVDGVTDLGDVSNVHIAGGTLNYVLATDGTGNLSWAPQVDNAGNTIPYISFVAQTDGANQQFANTLIAKYSSNLAMNVFRNGINIEPTQFILANPTTLQITQFLSTGDTIDILSTNSGSNITVGGNVTEIQYNGGNILSGSQYFTYNPGGRLLTTGNLSVTGNIVGGNLSVTGTTTLATANITTANITNANISNITIANVGFANANIGNLTVANIVSNVTFGQEVYLGPVGNVHIDGGTSGYVLSTDGAGNLSWVAQSGGGGNGSPGGSNTQVQFNSNGAFAGSSNFVFNSATNILTVTNIAGNGSRLTNLPAANIVGSVAAANVAYSVSGSNVTGTVANANFASFANSASFVTNPVAEANHANVADVANSVAGSNVVGTVANATYATNSGTAAVANSVSVANVSGIGNIATVNLTGSSSNVLYGNGVFAAVSANINANYANFAGNAFSVTGSNVVGTVGSANTAATVTTAAQPNITSVGTLTSLSVTGNVNSGNASVTGNITVGNLSASGTASANLGNFVTAELGNTTLFRWRESVQSIANTGSSITPNLQLTSIFQYTANANFSFNGLANAVAGSSATVIIRQDSTGGRTMTSTMLFAGGQKTLSTAANAVDVICLFYDGTTYYAALSKGYA